MSATPEEFYSKWAKVWKSITTSPAYKDAIDTVKQTSPSLRIMDFSPPEVKGIGDIILAKQQGVIETLQALDQLADVPPDFSDEQPPDSALYPDPLTELDEPQPKTKKEKVTICPP